MKNNHYSCCTNLRAEAVIGIDFGLSGDYFGYGVGFDFDFDCCGDYGLCLRVAGDADDERYGLNEVVLVKVVGKALEESVAVVVAGL